MATFGVIRMKLVIPVFYIYYLALYKFLQVKSEGYSSSYTSTIYISVKELSGLDQKLFQFLDIYISFKEPSGLDHKLGM